MVSSESLQDPGESRDSRAIAASPREKRLANPIVLGVEAESVPHKRGLSIVVKLTAIVALVVLPTVGVVLITGHQYWRGLMATATRANLAGAASNRAELLDAQIQLLRQRVGMSADRADFRIFLQADAAGQEALKERDASQKRLSVGLPDKKVILNASLANMHGDIVLSSNPTSVGRSLGYEPGFYAHLHDAYLGAPRRIGAKFLTYLIAPVLSKNVPVGFLVLNVDVSNLVAVIEKPIGPMQTAEILLISREKNGVRVLIPSRLGAQSTAAPVASAPEFDALLAPGSHFGEFRDYRGVPVLGAAQQVGYGSWWLIAKMDQGEAYLPIYQSLRWRLILGGLIASAGLLMAFLLVHKFTRPMRALAAASARVAHGDYTVQVPPGGHDEFGVLSASFNEMINAIRAQQAARDQASWALSEAHRRKDEFLAFLGHELRNPLSAIASATEIWKDAGQDPASAAQMGDVVSRQTASLTRLVDDLLDVSRIATGKFQLRKRAVDLAELTRHCMAALRPVIAARRHHLDVSIAAEPLFVCADPTRIEQIIGNLAANAAKYTPDGGRISVTTAREGDQALVTVHDNGNGIDPQALPRIFDLFAQSGRTFDRSTGGLGIGLHLCRQLIELHGGSISAASDGPGCGATFTLRLPLISEAERAALQVGPPGAVAVAGAHHRILLVDDNVESALLLAQLLVRRGHEVRATFDGLTALTAAQEFQPDVFLLDLGLPGLDGYALATRLRNEGFADALLIAISGFAADSDRQRAHEAGFAHHFAKPVELDELIALLAAAPDHSTKT